jgi:ParB family transcriptional regulator, chromosome partitioning protein
MTIKRNGLGKGLTALLQDSNTDVSSKNPIAANSISEIRLSEIEANPFQPRKEFDEGALDELAESIKLHGIIQPITVRKIGYGKYELVSGERRTRASIRAGLTTIPAYVRVANDQSMLEMALIENIHREDLNAIEIAQSYKRLLEECSLKQEELGDRIGKNRSTVTNYLRLLRLPEEIQIALRDNQITMGHARALLGIEDRDKQVSVLDDIIDMELSVRAVEELVKKIGKEDKPNVVPGKNGKPKTHSNGSFNSGIWEQKLSKLVNNKIKIKQLKNGKGEIVIPFKTEDDLAHIASLLEK